MTQALSPTSDLWWHDAAFSYTVTCYFICGILNFLTTRHLLKLLKSHLLHSISVAFSLPQVLTGMNNFVFHEKLSSPSFYGQKAKLNPPEMPTICRVPPWDGIFESLTFLLHLTYRMWRVAHLCLQVRGICCPGIHLAPGMENVMHRLLSTVHHLGKVHRDRATSTFCCLHPHTPFPSLPLHKRLHSLSLIKSFKPCSGWDGSWLARSTIAASAGLLLS